MLENPKPYEMITDFVTGEKVPCIGAEETRQRLERFLVETKGYDKKDIEVDANLEFAIGDETVRSNVDLVVAVGGKRFMVLKCVPGSLGSRHRETLAAARLLDTYQIPFAVITDAKSADVLDTITGQIIDQGMDAIPSKDRAVEQMAKLVLEPFPEAKVKRERIIFRAYDDMVVNVKRKLKSP